MMKRMERITLDGKNYPLPSGIALYECPEKKACYIHLCAEAIGLPKEQTDEPTEPPINMQEGPAAFEAWALLLHTYSDYKEVRLGLQDNVTIPTWPKEQPFLSGCGKNAYGHYNRFLYRVMKFREQYSWFQIADEYQELDKAVQRFEIAFHRNSLCNNAPDGPASSPGNKEGRVEAAFAEDDAANQMLKAQTAAQGVDVSKIYRQLPVGLFRGEKSRATQIFTANHSAIDLWGISEDGTKLAIYELKTANKMTGIITELMFYANYMRDLFVDCTNRCYPLLEGTERGYDALTAAYGKLTGIYAFMLADKLDVRVTRKILDEMNQNSAGIIYDAIRYDWESNGEKIKILDVQKHFQ